MLASNIFEKRVVRVLQQKIKKKSFLGSGVSRCLIPSIVQSSKLSIFYLFMSGHKWMKMVLKMVEMVGQNPIQSFHLQTNLQPSSNHLQPFSGSSSIAFETSSLYISCLGPNVSTLPNPQAHSSNVMFLTSYNHDHRSFKGGILIILIHWM